MLWQEHGETGSFRPSGIYEENDGFDVSTYPNSSLRALLIYFSASTQKLMVIAALRIPSLEWAGKDAATIAELVIIFTPL